MWVRITVTAAVVAVVSVARCRGRETGSRQQRVRCGLMSLPAGGWC
jgi:hypothetical protein